MFWFQREYGASEIYQKYCILKIVFLSNDRNRHLTNGGILFFSGEGVFTKFLFRGFVSG